MKLFTIWQHEKLLLFTTTTALQISPSNTTTIISSNEDMSEKKQTNNEDEDEISSQQSQNNRLRMSNFIFNSVISSRFMVVMEGRDERCFEVYGDFLVELIRHQFITMEHVNELSIGLYQHEWNKVCLCKNPLLVWINLRNFHLKLKSGGILYTRDLLLLFNLSSFCCNFVISPFYSHCFHPLGYTR